MAASKSDYERICRESCSNRRARCWLTTTPKEKQRLMSNQQFAVAIRTRLNLMPFANMPKGCICKNAAKLDDLSRPSHPHCCTKTKGPGVTTRHNTITQTLASLVRAAGLTPAVELRELPTADSSEKSKEPSRRPDIMIWSAAETLLVDVTVLHPLARSHMRTGIVPAMAARAKKKRDRYAELAKCYSGRVVPFVLDALVC